MNFLFFVGNEFKNCEESDNSNSVTKRVAKPSFLCNDKDVID